MLSRDLAEVAVTQGCLVTCGMVAGGIPTSWARVDVRTAPPEEPPQMGGDLGQSLGSSSP